VGIAEAADAIAAEAGEVALVEVGEGLFVPGLEALDERGVTIEVDVVSS
jgi:hypothetical protein